METNEIKEKDENKKEIKEIILIIFFLSSSPLKYVPLVMSESTTIINRTRTDNLIE